MSLPDPFLPDLFLPRYYYHRLLMIFLGAPVEPATLHQIITCIFPATTVYSFVATYLK